MKTIFKMKKLVILFTLAIFCFYGCSTEDVSTTDSETSVSDQFRANHGQVIHHVTLATNDACEALGLPNGCDGNFSLTANMHADGFVRGQWQDTYFGGGEGIHVSIDCFQYGETTNGFKYAIVAGIITKGTSGGVDVSGQRAVTLVADYGAGLQNDYMSFSINPWDADCDLLTLDSFPNSYYLLVSAGEVVVW